MITNSGKNILAKYLVGQTTSYASHIAIGCGTKPVVSDHTFSPAELLAMKNKCIEASSTAVWLPLQNVLLHKSRSNLCAGANVIKLFTAISYDFSY